MDVERELVKRIASGDERAFEELADTYGPLIWAVVRYHMRLLPNLWDECVNDILFSVWRNITRFDPDKNTLKNWIAAIGKYRCIDYKRKYARGMLAGEIPENLPAPDTAERAVLEEEAQRELDELLACLSPHDRDLFYRRYIRDEDIRTIARDQNTKPEVLYNRISRGRKRLKTMRDRKDGLHYEKRI